MSGYVILRGQGPEAILRVGPDPTPFTVPISGGGFAVCRFSSDTPAESSPPEAPVLTLTASLFGRTWTVTASATGFPVPTWDALTFTVDGTPQAITPTIVEGVRTYTFVTPSSLNPTALFLQISVSSLAGADIKSVSATVAADLILPAVVAGWDQATYVAGESVTAADLVRTITNPGAPVLTDGALTSSLRVNGSPVSLPYTAVAGVSMVHRVSWTHPSTGATFVDSPARVVQNNVFFLNVDSSNILTWDSSAATNTIEIIDNPPWLDGTDTVNSSDFSGGPVILFGGEITGTPVNGQTLTVLYPPFATADNAITAGTPNWQASGVDIGGATGTSYTISGQANGVVLRLRQPLTDANGTRNAFSNGLTVTGTTDLTITGGRTDGLLIDYTGTLTISSTRTDGLLVDVT
jgi:hypothetical protein